MTAGGRKPRCTRCGARYTKDSREDRANWNVDVRGGLVVGYTCPRCQTDAEDVEARVKAAALDYVSLGGGVVGVCFKDELDDETREFAERWIGELQREQREEGTW